MADKEDTSKEKKKESKDSVVETVADAPVEVKATKASTPWPLIIIAITGTVVVMVAVAGGWWLLASQDHNTQSNRLERSGLGQNFDDQQGQGSFGGGSRSGEGFGGRSGMMNAAARGVVTSIDGDTIKVSGSGKQVTVKKTSSTTISGDKTDIAVNDSVIVIGTTESDGTVTATRILIRNTSISDAAATPDV